jgi:hypothetical protein
LASLRTGGFASGTMADGSISAAGESGTVIGSATGDGAVATGAGAASLRARRFAVDAFGP